MSERSSSVPKSSHGKFYSRRLFTLAAGLALLALLIVVSFRPVPASADGAGLSAPSMQSSASPSARQAAPAPSAGVYVHCDPVVEGQTLPQSSR